MIIRFSIHKFRIYCQIKNELKNKYELIWAIIVRQKENISVILLFQLYDFVSPLVLISCTSVRKPNLIIVSIQLKGSQLVYSTAQFIAPKREYVY